MRRRSFLAAAPGLMCAGRRGYAQSRMSLRDVGAIDAHVHFYVPDPSLPETLERLNLRFVTVTVLDPYGGGYETMGPQHQACAGLTRMYKGRAAWLSSFDPREFESADFSDRVIASLDETFRQGAVGVKIYKTIGMDLRTKDGKYVMPDDPAFHRILEALAARGKTLYAHIAEPMGAWKPLDPADPDYHYYKNNPAWHIASQPGRPSKAAILAARDRMLAAHPKLRVVGCHLGSLEESVDELAERLDRYPNFAVDLAARVDHLFPQAKEKVRAFMMKYQDRVLYATDVGILPGPDVAAKVKGWESYVERNFAYFAGASGLGLPEAVVRKIFRENAVKWVPGVG